MKKNKKSPFQWVGTALVLLQLGKAGYDFIKGSKDKKEAEEELARRREAMEDRKRMLTNMDFRVQNPYEDIDVTTKAAEFAKEQSAQTTADILDRLAPNVGGSGAAALATSVARQSLKAAKAQQARQEALELQLKQKAAGAQLAIDQSVNRAEYQRNADLFNLEAMGAAGAQAQLNSAQAQVNAGISQAINTGVNLLGNYLDKKTTTTTPDTKKEEVITEQDPTSSDKKSTYELIMGVDEGPGYDPTKAQKFIQNERGMYVPQIATTSGYYSNENNVVSNPYSTAFGLFYEAAILENPDAFRIQPNFAYTGKFAGVEFAPGDKPQVTNIFED